MKIVFVLLLLALAVGCSKAATKLDTSLQTRAEFAGGYAEPAYEVAYVDSDEVYSKSAIYPMPPLPEPIEPEMSLDRMVIKDARLSIEVSDYEAAQIKIMNLAQKYGGFVSGSNSYRESDDRQRGFVSFRIPSLHFDAALIEAGAVGRVLSQSVSGDDVTENYYDTAARLNNSRREEQRLLTILEKAEKVDDILRVERELARVRGEVESAEGRLRYLDNHVSYSSITVELQEPSPVVKKYGIWDAIKDAVNLCLATVRFLIRAIGFLLPLIILGSAAAAVIVWRVRKSRRRR